MVSLMITNTTLAIFPIIRCDQSRHKMHHHRKLAKTQMQYLIQILKIPEVQPEVPPEVQPEVDLGIDQSVIDHHHKESFQEVHQEPVGEENNVGNVIRSHMRNAQHPVNTSRVHQVMKIVVLLK